MRDRAVLGGLLGPGCGAGPSCTCVVPERPRGTGSTELDAQLSTPANNESPAEAGLSIDNSCA
jgi:hypothetical protein